MSGNLVLNMLFWVWGVYVDWLSEVSFYYPKACARVSPHIPRDRQPCLEVLPAPAEVDCCLLLVAFFVAMGNADGGEGQDRYSAISRVCPSAVVVPDRRDDRRGGVLRGSRWRVVLVRACLCARSRVCTYTAGVPVTCVLVYMCICDNFVFPVWAAGLKVHTGEPQE